MGIIKAVASAVEERWRDQAEAIEPMIWGTGLSLPLAYRRRGKGSNTKGSSDIVSNGSVI